MAKPWHGTFARQPRPVQAFIHFVGTHLRHHACDRCGYSGADGKPISAARWHVRTPSGDLFFCGHHFHKHCAHIESMAYETFEVKQ
jgi:hypothetical protein